MEDKLIEQAKILLDLHRENKCLESLIISREFIKSILGEDSSFYKTLHQDQDAVTGGFKEDFKKSFSKSFNILKYILHSRSSRMNKGLRKISDTIR